MKAVVGFCKTCRTCQIVMKPNQVVAPAPLHPIPVVGEPFECVIVDCVGPLPSTKYGYQFLLTLMYVSILFPQANPLWKNHNHNHNHLAYQKWCRLTKELIFWPQLSNNLYSSWVSLTLRPEHITQSQGTTGINLKANLAKVLS